MRCLLCVLRQFIVGDVPFRGPALHFEFIDLLLQLGDDFVQIGFALRKSFDLFRLNVVIQIDGAELGDLSIEQGHLLADPSVECAIG
jgi:hypothetical protein